MRRIKVVACVFVLLLCFCSLKAQKINYEAFIGVGTNIVSVKSDYSVDNNAKLKPAYSLHGGGLVTIGRNRLALVLMPEYLLLKNKVGQDFEVLDNAGVQALNLESSIVNHAISLSTLGKFQISKNWYVGIGISGGITLKSTFKTEDQVKMYETAGNPIYGNALNYDGEALGKRFDNHSSRSVFVVVPVIVGYNFNRVSLNLHYYKGLTNINRSESYLREYNNTILLGIAYSFKAEK